MPLRIGQIPLRLFGGERQKPERGAAIGLAVGEVAPVGSDRRLFEEEPGLGESSDPLHCAVAVIL